MNQTNPAITNIARHEACRDCFEQPCERLRLGGGSPGSMLFLHTRRLGQDFDTGCPHAARSFDEIESLLALASASEIDGHLVDVLADLSAGESRNFDHRSYIRGFGDQEGRIAFLRALFEAGVVRAVLVPHASPPKAPPGGGTRVAGRSS